MITTNEAIQVLYWALNRLDGHNYIIDGYGTVDPSAKLDAFSMAIDALAMQGEPVRHGHWENIADFGAGHCIGICSRCHARQRANNRSALIGGYRYCRWCGAKMDEVVSE